MGAEVSTLKKAALSAISQQDFTYNAADYSCLFLFSREQLSIWRCRNPRQGHPFSLERNEFHDCLVQDLDGQVRTFCAANGAKSTPRGKKGAGRRIGSGLGPTVGIQHSYDEYIYVSPVLINRGFLWRTDVCLLINGPGNWDTRSERGRVSWWGEQHHQRGRAYATTRSRSPWYTERCFIRSTSRANALTIQNFPTSVQELSSELTVLTFKLSNQITRQQPVDTTAISRTAESSHLGQKLTTWAI